MKNYKYVNYKKNGNGSCRITDKGRFYNKIFKTERELESFVDDLGYPIYSYHMLPLKERNDFWKTVENDFDCPKDEIIDILLHLLYYDKTVLEDVKMIVAQPYYFHV